MDQVAAIRSKIDIVQLIQEYLPLKKMGRNFKTNCPFHGEKTPSFVVSPERQIWHCFGCQKGGDVYSFLMEYEHIEFPEALRILADKTGVVLENQHIDSGLSSKKERLYGLNRLASEFYHYLLTKHELGKEALTYLTKDRHMKVATMKTFQVGFSPRTGNALVTYLLKKKGYTKEEILESGLGTLRNGRLYDFFHGRIMFALCDHRDNVIGFSGRVLKDAPDTSKYINTRETLIYHKGSTFFGFNIAKEEIKKTGRIILMEGEFDVISSFQEGVGNAVAVKGTALTDMQVNLLARFTKHVAVCFDMDKAGQEALRRSIPLLEKKQLQTSVIVLSNGKDPDESIQNNPIEYKQAVRKDIGVYDFLLSEVLKKYDSKTAEGKRAVTSELLPLFNLIENEIVKEHYLHELGNTIGISQDSLQKELEKLRKQTIVKKDIPSTKPNRKREEILEEYLVAMLVQSSDPAGILSTITSYLVAYAWNMPAYQKIVEHVQGFLAQHPLFDQSAFLNSLPQELVNAFDACFLLPLPSMDDIQKYKDEAQRVAKDMQEIYARKQIAIIGDAIAQQEKNETTVDLENLQEELAHFVSLLSKKE